MTRFFCGFEPSIIAVIPHTKPAPHAIRPRQRTNLHRPHRDDLHVPAAGDHQRVRGAADPPEHADAGRRDHQRRRRLGAGPRPVHPGRLRDDRRQHLRLHRRQGGPSAAAPVAVRRVLGLDARSVLGSRAAGRADLPVFVARAQRLRPDRGADADLLDHDELRARPRRVAGGEMQGRLHGAARADRAVHDRRVHRSDGGRALGDPGAVDPGGGQPDLLHLPRAEQPADAAARRLPRLLQPRLLLDRRARPRSPTTCG